MAIQRWPGTNDRQPFFVDMRNNGFGLKGEQQQGHNWTATGGGFTEVEYD